MLPYGVLFDLDDTLVDHSRASRMALDYLRNIRPELSSLDSDDLVRLWNLNFDHGWKKVLFGEISILENRANKIQFVFSTLGLEISGGEAMDMAESYGSEYLRQCTVIPGTFDLLRRLRDRNVRIGVITNNIQEMKYHKVDRLGLLPYIDSITLSSEYRMMKPDPEIFNIALNNLGGNTINTLMLGDSFEHDIIGAHRVGMKHIWFNRFGKVPGEEGFNVNMISSYLPLEDTIVKIESVYA